MAFDGDPYLDDTELADLFAFLLPANESRRRVKLDEDLRDVIVRPVDTNAIQAKTEEFDEFNEHMETVLEILNYGKFRQNNLPLTRE